jgi:hypothetical protein
LCTKEDLRDKISELTFDRILAAVSFFSWSSTLKDPPDVCTETVLSKNPDFVDHE